LNEHFHEAGDVIFRHACKLGLEGIVSKRLGSRYRSGRHISEQAQRQPLQDEDVALVTGKYDADDRNSPKIKT
jgi:ATP-dependent DNA ligase